MSGSDDHVTQDQGAALAAALSDRYRVERELGAGGMATVYLAEDLKHHRRVAIKVLHPELGAALGVERFEREIEIAAQLRHPHVLPLFDSGIVESARLTSGPGRTAFFYYTMPFVEGETLRARMDREKQLPVEEALRIAREVADALSYAHARGVVHRDIKPENILLEAGHAVVADFGIAKAIAAASEQSALTRTGTSIGTPTYMSPEQAAGDGELDGRSDLYSLGCMLFEMLAGQPPFTGPTVESLVRQHLTTPAPPVTQFRAAVPGAVSDALARALSKNPADRFNPVDQFAAALVEDVSSTRPLDASSSRRFGRSTSRRWVVAGSVALLVLAVVAWMRFGPASSGDVPPSVAVLPFQLASGDSAAASLALGLHGELVTELTTVPGLRVASRQTVLDYRREGKSATEVANDLGVASLVSGNVQRAGNQVRLTVSLTDPVHDQELWAESYDRELTAENVFAIETEVARAVVGALRLTLAPGDSISHARPTTSLPALELYYRGEDLFNSGFSDAGDSLALEFAERAVELDPAFVRGWRLVAKLRSWRVRTGKATDTIPARRAMERATALAPSSTDARLAAGYYRYYALADFEGALREMDAASRVLPGSSELVRVRALLLRRLGRFDDALALFRRAVELDPASETSWYYLGETLMLMRRYPQADSALMQALRVKPTSSPSVLYELESLAFGQGDTAAARRFLDEHGQSLAPFTFARLATLLAAYARDIEAAVRVPVPPSVATDMYVSLDNPYLTLAVLAHAERDRRSATLYADSLVNGLTVWLTQLRETGDPFGIGAAAELQVAVAEVLLGRTQDGVARAEAAMRAHPLSDDAVDGVDRLRWLAATYSLAGRTTDAITTLQRVTAVPGPMGPGDLELNPIWDSLRDDPAFRALLDQARAATR